ncbi:MAG: ABC transporter substrate-binding protein [Rhodococcus sp. (in: high G+C Gram-positive bacteria)]|uniref:ABC transporter substrate-binding protein n=1 Tax=Rhodococcus sp. TaxID=1831 RepID=UPI002ADADDC8|nr:ABC transporter substrate-binding protein [Rhodococcus sp. (in: high G+C Gram-positive bacteria)]
MKPSIARVLGLAVAAALTAAACTSPSDEGSGEAIVLADSQELGGFSPVSGYGALGVSPVYEGLLRPDADSDAALPDLVPSLAASGPMNTAPRQWKVTLRTDVTFSDGTDFDAADVVATYEAVKSPTVASEISTDFDPIVDIVSDGSDAVVVTMNTDADPSPYLLLGIAPSERIENAPAADWALNTEPVGTGPYVLDSLRADQAVFTAREDYWGEAPQVTRLVITYTPDDNTRVQRVATGEVSGTSLPPTAVAALDGNDDVTTVGVKSADWRGVSLPADNAFTADPQARIAMNLAVDRGGMVDDVLGGYGRPASTPVADVYGDAYDSTAVFPFDLASAESTLDAAGWRVGADGVREKDGATASFELLYNAQDSVRRDLAVAFAAAMQPVGIDVRPRGTGWDEIETRLGDAAVMLGGGDTPYSIDSQVYDTLHTRVDDSSPYANPGNFTAPGMDELLQQARDSASGPDNDARYRQIQQLYLEQPSSVFLTFLDHAYAYRDLGWNQSPPILEPHSHGVSWGPWWHLAAWTRAQ